MTNSIAFLDRDGVLNVDTGYVYKKSEFEWTEGAIETVKFLNQNNFLVIVVTNQAGIGRGYYTEEDVNKLHDFMNEELGKYCASIDDFFYSPYHPDGIHQKYKYLKNLRKPNTGMLDLAEKKWGINKSKSFLVGDMNHDVICAKNFGIKSFLFNEKNLYNFLIPKISNLL